MCAERSGELLCGGRNGLGQLGTLGLASSPAPREVDLPPFSDWCVGNDHVCALLVDGTVRCWGSNGYGQAGIDGPSAIWTPTEVTALRRAPL